MTIKNRSAAVTLLTLICLTSSLFTSAVAQPLNNLKLHSVGIQVSDLQRSLAFYQSLLGVTEIGRDDNTIYLQLGDGPQYIALKSTPSNDSPRIAYIGLSADSFASKRFAELLQQHGFQPSDPVTITNANRLQLAKTYWLDDAALNFVAAEGVPFQVSDTTFCGSTTFTCRVAVTQKADKLHLLGINHFTTFMANAPRANEAYMNLLALAVQSYQGPNVPALAVGDGKQFLMFVGGAAEGEPSNPANLHHVSFMVSNFTVDGIFTTLKAFGLSPRPEGANPAPPLSYYVSLRMPNRGGAEGGTPEVYFTDPDGILLQVQDPSYCGGGGYLGDQC